MKTRTETLALGDLKLAYELSGPRGGEPVLLVHGWPDSPRTWDGVLPLLHEAGYRAVVPFIRSFGRSTFRHTLFGRGPKPSGEPVAIAEDMLRLADKLRMKHFHFVGHDWGARTGYAIAALHPHRLKTLTSISVPWVPGPAKPPNLEQAPHFWYQWLLCTRLGAEKLRSDPVAFGRAQWDTWSPAGWYTEAEFQAAAASWHQDVWPDVVLSYYRSRLGEAPPDRRYAKASARFLAVEKVSVPTLLIHGREDTCVLVKSTEGAGTNFIGPYRRVVVDRVGHFPQRENPGETARQILAQVREFGG